MEFNWFRFRWRRLKNNNRSSFIGVVRDSIIEIEQSENCCHVKAYSNGKLEFEPREALEQYLQVHFPIEDFYAKWSSRDTKQFARKAALLTGVRMLQQDPFENVISFICSQNNNISRIGQLVSKICSNYGTIIGNIHDEDFYTFPTLVGLYFDSSSLTIGSMSWVAEFNFSKIYRRFKILKVSYVHCLSGIALLILRMLSSSYLNSNLMGEHGCYRWEVFHTTTPNSLCWKFLELDRRLANIMCSINSIEISLNSLPQNYLCVS